MLLSLWASLYDIVDWNHVSNDQLSRIGGESLLLFYPSAGEASEYLTKTDSFNVDNAEEYWKDVKHVKSFLDRFGAEQRVAVPMDWSQIDPTAIKEAGGRGLLRAGNLYDHLRHSYPEEDWEPLRPSLDPTFWDERENQRVFLDFLCQFYSLERPEELFTVPTANIHRVGGREVLKRFSSRSEMLRNVYPERVWPSVQSHHEWKDPQRHYEFLQYVEQVFKMKSLEDWRQVTHNAFRRLGGSRILEQYGNLHEALRNIYGPERVSEDPLQVRSKVNRGDNQRYEVRKRLADDLQNNLNIQHMEDWYRLTYSKIRDYSRRSLNVLKSPNAFLPELFPHFHWDLLRFPLSHSFWKRDLGAHLEAAESLARYVGIKDPVEWTRFSVSDFEEHSAKRCLLYHHSLLALILLAHPHRKTDILEQAQPTFWADRRNVETLLMPLEKELQLTTKFHWYTLSQGHFSRRPGFRSLLQQYGTWAAVMRLVYPTVTWYDEFFDQSDHVAPADKLLQCALLHIFSLSPNLPLLVNHYVPEMGQTVTAFLPNQRVAFVLRPPSHYDTVEKDDPDRFARLAAIDKSERTRWEASGYRLVAFPFWAEVTPATIRSRLIAAGGSDVEEVIFNRGRPNLLLQRLGQSVAPPKRKRL